MTGEQSGVVEPSLGYVDMQETLTEAGLGDAPVPLRLRADVEQVRPWFWSTTTVGTAGQLYLGGYPGRRSKRPTRRDDSFALCHVGHGLNSWFLCCLVTYRGRTLYSRAHWGGNVYETVERQDDNVRRMFTSIRDDLDELNAVGETS